MRNVCNIITVKTVVVFITREELRTVYARFAIKPNIVFLFIRYSLKLQFGVRIEV